MAQSYYVRKKNHEFFDGSAKCREVAKVAKRQARARLHAALTLLTDRRPRIFGAKWNLKAAEEGARVHFLGGYFLSDLGGTALFGRVIPTRFKSLGKFPFLLVPVSRASCGGSASTERVKRGEVTRNHAALGRKVVRPRYSHLPHPMLHPPYWSVLRALMRTFKRQLARALLRGYGWTDLDLGVPPQQLQQTRFQGEAPISLVPLNESSKRSAFVPIAPRQPCTRALATHVVLLHEPCDGYKPGRAFNGLVALRSALELAAGDCSFSVCARAHRIRRSFST